MNRRNDQTDQHKATKTSSASKEPKQEQRSTCHANEEVHLLLDNLAGFLFGSCASVVEAASLFVPDSWQSGKNSHRSVRKNQRSIDPTLAKLAGRYQSKSINPREPGAGIPSCLEGETLNYSFEEQTIFDDNISALSAYTLEEMARMNHAAKPVSRLGGKRSPLNSPPSVARTNSSSSSDHEHARYLFSSARKPLAASKDRSHRKR